MHSLQRLRKVYEASHVILSLNKIRRLMKCIPENVYQYLAMWITTFLFFMEKIAGLVDKFLIHSSYLRATNYSDSFVPFYFYVTPSCAANLVTKRNQKRKYIIILIFIILIFNSSFHCQIYISRRPVKTHDQGSLGVMLH